MPNFLHSGSRYGIILSTIMAVPKKLQKKNTTYIHSIKQVKKLVKTRKKELIAGTLIASAVLLYLVAFFVSRNTTYPAMISTIPEPTQTTATPTPKVRESEITEMQPSTENIPASYTVKSGDTAYELGLIFCHDESAWVKILHDNKLRKHSKMYEGDILTISCK